MSDLERFIREFRELETSGLIIQIAQFLLWVVVILILGWLARKVINRTVANDTMRYHARKVTRILSYVLILILVLITVAGQVRYFTLAIGLIGAGIAFALQEVILSIAGWVAIFSTNMFKPGDRIEVNNVKGDVIDISVTKTTLMEIGNWVKSDNYTGRIVQISNSVVFKNTVHNYSTDFPFVWDEIILPVKYGSDITLANEVILEAAQSILKDYATYAKNHWSQMVKKYLIENANVEPTLTFKLTDNWIEFNLRFVVDYKMRRTTKHMLFRDIHQAIEQTNGKVKLASTSLEIIGVPDLKVNVNKSDGE